MILICKNYKEENESYEEVIDWLLYNNAQFEFFSGENFYDSGNDWSMQLGNSQINSSNKTNTYKSVWFRSFLNIKLSFLQYLKILIALILVLLNYDGVLVKK